MPLTKEPFTNSGTCIWHPYHLSEGPCSWKTLSKRQGKKKGVLSPKEKKHLIESIMKMKH